MELLVDQFERDVEEWRRLSRSDLESSVDEQLAHLVAQMQEARLAAQEVAKAISSDLKSLEKGKQRLEMPSTPPPVLFLMLKIGLRRPRR